MSDGCPDCGGVQVAGIEDGGDCEPYIIYQCEDCGNCYPDGYESEKEQS